MGLRSFFVVVVFCSATWVSAQEINASLAGTVSDTSGAIVPSASVEIVNANTGVIGYRGVTNASGVYSAPSLPVGAYRLIIESPGFKKAEILGIILQVDQRARVNVTLSPGEVAETITAVGEGLGQEYESPMTMSKDIYVAN